VLLKVPLNANRSSTESAVVWLTGRQLACGRVCERRSSSQVRVRDETARHWRHPSLHLRSVSHYARTFVDWFIDGFYCSVHCTRSMVDRWPLCGMGQPTRPTLPSIPPESVNVVTSITGWRPC